MKSFEEHFDYILSAICDAPTNVVSRRSTSISYRTMLSVSGMRGEHQSIPRSLAVNDLVLDIGDPFRAIDFKVFIGGCELGSVRGDGVIISTPTGSTAYNLSASGPIIQPELLGLAITPKNPYRLSIRPIVVRSDEEITIQVSNTPGAWAIIDGQERHKLDVGPGEEEWKLFVRSANDKMQIVSNPDRNHWNILVEKLHWGL